MKFVVDQAEIRDVEDLDDSVEMKAVIAQEMVQDYPRKGVKIYKPAEELEAATFTADGAYVTEGHPEGKKVTEQDEIKGFVRNPEFEDGAIVADLEIRKAWAGEDLVQDLLEGNITDVSIGFSTAEDFSQGEFNGTEYDRVQRDIVIDHVALAPPGMNGRCSSDAGCGIIGNIEAPAVAADLAVEDEELGQKALEVLRENDVEAEKRPCSCGDHEFHVTIGDSSVASGPERASGDFNNDGRDNSSQEDEIMSDDINDLSKSEVKQHSAVQDIISEKESLEEKKESLEADLEEVKEEKESIEEDLEELQESRAEDLRSELVSDYPVTEEKVEDMELDSLEMLEDSLEKEEETDTQSDETDSGEVVDTNPGKGNENQEEGPLEPNNSRSMKV